jgi:hypothetical protein
VAVKIVEADIVEADIVEADIVEADIVEADIVEADIVEAVLFVLRLDQVVVHMVLLLDVMPTMLYYH